VQSAWRALAPPIHPNANFMTSAAADETASTPAMFQWR
jgi:hypothetical protein